MERILDFSQPLDVQLLDQVVDAFFQGGADARAGAQRVLTEFQQHPDAWLRVDSILELSRNPNTKFLALSILESVIKFRWKALPREHCDGIKQFIVAVIIKLSSSAETLASEKMYLGKLNHTLVQIVKQEWPQRWETFIPEIVGSSKTNEAICENNMQILLLLSEEVFDFSSGAMTAAKAAQLKASFNKDFSLIFELCQIVLAASQRPSLLHSTLETLLRFLNWIPAGYVLQTQIIDVLAGKFLPEPLFRTVTIQCLTEIAGLTVPDCDAQFRAMLSLVMGKVRAIIDPSADLSQLFARAELERDQEFCRHLALFLTTFFRNHRTAVECSECASDNLSGHEYLAKITAVDDEEIFKICLEYWFTLASDLYHEAPHLSSAVVAAKNPLMLAGDGAIDAMSAAATAAANTTPRRTFYAAVLSKVRQVVIVRFAKPEEVLITEDENGEVVREYVKDTEVTALYKLMREVLVYLTHLDYADTQEIMLSRLHAQVDGSNWSRQELNSLSWAVGSISGAVHEDLEKRFVVTVIRDLLGLVEMKRGKDNKAAIAGNIMYVVGQYPRFLRAHWKFLKTVVNKLFEFMHESHPGVQDMAVDTFLKIATKCKRKFVVTNAGEARPFVEDILDNIAAVTCDLEAQQQNVFYSAMGQIISSQPDQGIRDSLISRLMALPNQAWAAAMQDAATSIGTLRNVEVMKRLVNILRANVSAASALGPAFASQLGRIYLDMLNVYRVYSEAISAEVSSGIPHATKTVGVKYMRSVKQEVLRLVESYIEHSQPQDAEVIAHNFVPPLLQTVLPDYSSSAPDARDAQVLSLMACVIDRLTWSMTPEIPRVFAHVFASTLDMITKNFVDYPDHRIHFFELIRAINGHCFDAFFTLTPEQFKLVMDSIVWAMKHTERTVAVSGLTILSDLLTNIASHPNIADGFYVTYYRSVLQDLFFVLTDTFHKAEFKQHAMILKHLFTIVETGQVKAPLFQEIPGCENNQQWLRHFVTSLLTNAFPNVAPQKMQAYVLALADVNKDLPTFKQHLRDFLVSIQEFSGGSDNAELFLEEQEAAEAKARDEERQRLASIPGMLKPSEMPDDMGE